MRRFCRPPQEQCRASRHTAEGLQRRFRWRSAGAPGMDTMPTTFIWFRMGVSATRTQRCSDACTASQRVAPSASSCSILSFPAGRALQLQGSGIRLTPQTLISLAVLPERMHCSCPGLPCRSQAQHSREVLQGGAHGQLQGMVYEIQEAGLAHCKFLKECGQPHRHSRYCIPQHHACMSERVLPAGSAQATETCRQSRGSHLSQQWQSRGKE